MQGLGSVLEEDNIVGFDDDETDEDDEKDKQIADKKAIKKITKVKKAKKEDKPKPKRLRFIDVEAVLDGADQPESMADSHYKAIHSRVAKLELILKYVERTCPELHAMYQELN